MVPEQGVATEVLIRPEPRVEKIPAGDLQGVRSSTGAPRPRTHRPGAVVPDAVHQPQLLQLLLLEARAWGGRRDT